MKLTEHGAYAGRTNAHFTWWDDALGHARWLAAREQRRYRVTGLGGRWVVRPALDRGGSVMAKAVAVEVECDACRHSVRFTGRSTLDLDEQVDAAGWLRNKATDRDLCPSCIEVTQRTGYHVDGRLL